MSAPSHADGAPSLPPAKRSRVAHGLTAAAAVGRFELQTCLACGAVQYPPREACFRCLSVRLEWQEQPSEGELLSVTTLHHSNEPYFRSRLPRRTGLVRLDCGPSVVAHLSDATLTLGARVRLDMRLDRSGSGVLVAGEADEMSCDPNSRTVLVTDGTSPGGLALVKALSAAGATVLTSTASEFHILINNPSQEVQGSGVAAAREAMEVHCFGLMRLVQEFAPRMRMRNSGDSLKSLAWVNVLSIYALSASAEHEAESAAAAAALAVSQSLRAQMQPAGIRVVNVFTGAIGPEALAQAIVDALQRGLEDVFPGDVAQSWLARYRQNPKALERDLASV